ncbi:MAG: amidohydrolase family protein [Rhodospirillales bacterium]
MDSRLLLYNARLVLPDADPRAPLPTGAVLVESGRIAAVVTLPEEIAELAAATQRADLAGQVLIPGLISAHSHSYSTAARGTENSLPLEPWALYTVAYGRALGDETFRLAVLLTAAEMLRSGITGALDHFAYAGRAEVALAAHRETGMRIALAPMLHDQPDHDLLNIALPDGLRRRVEGAKRPGPAELGVLFRRLHRDWHGRDGRLFVQLGPNAPQRCSPALWTLWRELAQELGMRAHTHLLETRPQAGIGRRLYDGGLVHAMARKGLLNEHLSVAHGVWAEPGERALLAQHGVTVVHNPISNLMLGSGILPMQDYRIRGVRIALGSDGSNSGGRHDLFEVMRLAMMLPRPGIDDPADWPGPGDAFTWATEGGAQALGLAGKVGCIAPGYCADLVVLDMETAARAALVPNLAAVVQYGGADSVRAVMIDGNWVYRDGKVLVFDEDATRARFVELRAEILSAAQPELATADEAAAYFCGSTART